MGMYQYWLNQSMNMIKLVEIYRYIYKSNIIIIIKKKS